MFKQLLAALKSGETLDRAFTQFEEMLDHAHWMFVRANEVLQRQYDVDEAKTSIYARDKAINDLLRSIRRKIVRQLTINPGSDVAPCLALMSMARDAERIGDYCKNVFEVGQFYDEPFHVDVYHEPLDDLRHDFDRLFEMTRTAVNESDATRARNAIELADGIKDRCDALIEQLLRDRSKIQTHEAVAYSLLSRHYKRVASHLSNICTGVAGKIEDLDFRLPEPAEQPSN